MQIQTWQVTTYARTEASEYTIYTSLNVVPVFDTFVIIRSRLLERRTNIRSRSFGWGGQGFALDRAVGLAGLSPKRYMEQSRRIEYADVCSCVDDKQGQS